MAISTLRDRQSIVSINALFSGPSVVPDGSFAQGDRQTIGYGYYGINVGTTVTTSGGTSQLDPITASGGLDVGRKLGAVSQLELITATGGIDVLSPKTLGAISQLEAFTASGGLQAPTATAATGGFWVEYAEEVRRRRREQEERDRKRKLALKIKSDLDKALALAEAEIADKEARDLELGRLTLIAESYKKDLQKVTNERITFIALEAINRHTYSAMERFERELAKLHKEEEDFLIMATEILVMNQ